MNRTAYEKDLLHRLVSSILKYGGSEILSSIILTGSFGRDEPTYTLNGNGVYELKSDVEIALIVSGTRYIKKAVKLVRDVSSEFTEELNLMVFSETRIRKRQNFNYSFQESKYKTLFMYDLFNGSKTIWGKDFLKDNQLLLKDVDMYEAKRLVANRVGELSYIKSNISDSSALHSAVQWKGKVMLALGSAWLILNQAYQSSYHSQFERLKACGEQVSKDLGQGFLEEYERVFEYLRDNKQLYEVPDEKLRGFVKNMDGILKSLRIMRPKVNSISRIVKYYLKYIKTGLRFGLFGFEDRILQMLISQYCQDDPAISHTADVWYRVLY